MIPAADAVFSETWPDETRGKRLKQFSGRGAATGVTDLVELGPAASRADVTSGVSQDRRIDQSGWSSSPPSAVNRGLLA